MSAATLLAALAVDDGWQELGACVREDADLFFARQGDFGRVSREAEAKARCASCPVLASCLEWALAAGNPSGVWAGGTTTTERLQFEHAYRLAS